MTGITQTWWASSLDQSAAMGGYYILKKAGRKGGEEEEKTQKVHRAEKCARLLGSLWGSAREEAL